MLEKNTINAKKKDTGQEPVFRPYSEAIERMDINWDVSSQNDTYEVVTENTQSKNARLRIVKQDMQDGGLQDCQRTPLFDFLRGVNGHKCLFADFNGISIKGMLHHLCVYLSRGWRQYRYNKCLYCFNIPPNLLALRLL